MFKVAVGHSEDPYTEDATDEVITQCRENLNGLKPNACMVFSAIDYDYSIVLKKVQEAFPGVQLVGCSSSGELSSKLGYTEGSLLLIAFASDVISMAASVARDISKNKSESVNKALREIKQKLKGKPSLCFIFPDIFTIGAVSLVEELKQKLGQNFPILGGGASDPWQFDQTHEFYNQEILQDAAPMLFFSGPLEYVFNVGSGWEPFTTQKPIVKADKNIIFKIGDNTALDFYKHYLGGSPTLAHPLAVFEKDEKRFYLRVVFGINEETGSVVVGGDLPKCAKTSICQADPQNLINETQILIQQTIKQLGGKKPACAMIISCSCRQKILGTKTKDEFQILKNEIPDNVPVFGFYAYGQISPFSKDQSPFVHNESLITLFLYPHHEP
jgi:hypothetical protein